jgi:hypothetical protein
MKKMFIILSTVCFFIFGIGGVYAAPVNPDTGTNDTINDTTGTGGDNESDSGTRGSDDDNGSDSGTRGSDDDNSSSSGARGPGKVSCKDYKEITGTVWLIIRIAAPVLLLIYGAIDMGKAVMAGDEKEMKKATDTFVKRIILCVAIFLLPIVVDLIMGIFSGEGITACL